MTEAESIVRSMHDVDAIETIKETNGIVNGKYTMYEPCPIYDLFFKMGVAVTVKSATQVQIWFDDKSSLVLDVKLG